MLGFLEYIKIPSDYLCSYDEGIYSVMEKNFKKNLDAFLENFLFFQKKENPPSLPQHLVADFPFVDFTPFKGEIFSRKQDIVLLEKMIDNYFFKNKSVLEIGAWNSWLTNRLHSKGLNIISVDIFRDEKNGLLAKKFHQNNDWLSLQADITKTNIYAKKFDIIILNHCLQFLSNHRALAIDYSRLLNENGKLIILGMSFFKNAQRRSEIVKAYRVKHFEKHHFQLAFYDSKGFFDEDDFKFFRKNNFEFTGYKFSLPSIVKKKLLGNKGGVMCYTNSSIPQKNNHYSLFKCLIL